MSPLKIKITYIEVNKNESLFKVLTISKTNEKLPDGIYGVVYKKQVYPVIKFLIEENQKRDRKRNYLDL